MGAKPIWDVMVVDDMPQFGKLVEQYTMMIDIPCHVRWLSTLEEAEKILRTRPPHLLLLDMNMPTDHWMPPQTARTNHQPGTTLSFCQRVVSDPTLARVAVVMVSVESQAKDQARKAGAHAFYNKYDFTVDVFEDILLRISARYQ